MTGEEDQQQDDGDLTDFIKKHPFSSISAASDEPGRRIVEKPWGDDTVALVVNDGDTDMITVLNAVYLPERYSAIYHVSEQALEVAYTVFPPTGGNDISKRAFEFLHLGQTYKCRFGPSSDALLHLARHFRPVTGFGSSNHRNLGSYNTYMLLKSDEFSAPEELEEAYKNASPVSFWIENIEWDDDDVADLVYHLNFYMNYYDRQTPVVLVHTPADESRRPNPQKRFPFERFPAQIRSNQIDRSLLHFWTASLNGDPARRYLYNYQILEYCAHYIIEEEIKKEIARLLSTPHASAAMENTIEKIVDSFASSKISDVQKVDQLLKRCVDPQTVWKAIAENIDYFAEETAFEGGYTTSVLIKKGWTASDFSTNWPGPFAKEIRNLRNALSHGRESRMNTVVMPTVSNMRLLQPWVPAIAAAAREVMTFRHLS